MKAERIRDEDGVLNQAARDGGAITVYARHSLGSGHGRYLRIGYGFRIEVDNSVRNEKKFFPKAFLFSWAVRHEFQGNGDIYSETRLPSFELITNKAEDSVDKIDKLASEHLLKILARVSEESRTLTPKQKKAISLLKTSVGTKV
jgi:hypothetical protein